MSTVVAEWIVPTDLNTALTYNVNVYRSTDNEDGDYSLIETISAGPSNSTYTYTDGSGDVSFFYYVTYQPTSGSAGSRVLARIQPTVREQRLRDKIYQTAPEVIQVRIDANKTQIRDAIRQALSMVNTQAPVTYYSLSNMPAQHETAVEIGAQMLLYMEQYLQISIRDFSYGVSGIALNVDRGAKVNQAIMNLTKYWNDFIKTVKYADYPDAIGVGSSSLALPSARMLGALYNIPS